MNIESTGFGKHNHTSCSKSIVRKYIELNIDTILERTAYKHNIIKTIHRYVNMEKNKNAV